jgi:peptide/nickel transport system substrate-binding protein
VLTWPKPQGPIMDNKVCNAKIAPGGVAEGRQVRRTVGRPYVYDAASSTTGSVYSFTKNPNHWDTANYPYAKLVVKVITSETAAVSR